LIFIMHKIVKNKHTETPPSMTIVSSMGWSKIVSINSLPGTFDYM
jgi:hypothetical protein